MNTEKLSIYNALKFGFATFFSKFPIFIGIIALFYVPLLFVHNFFSAGITNLWFAFSVSYFFLGLTRIALQYYDNKITYLRSFFVPIKLVFRYMIAEGLAILVTSIIPLICAGIIRQIPSNLSTLICGAIMIISFLAVFVRTHFISYCMIDNQTGVIDSFEQSWNITEGHTLFLIGYFIVCSLINILTITIPITFISRAYIYRKLSPKKEPFIIGQIVFN